MVRDRLEQDLGVGAMVAYATMAYREAKLRHGTIAGTRLNRWGHEEFQIQPLEQGSKVVWRHPSDLIRIQ